MIKDSLKTIALSLAILSLISVAYAWTEPSSNPPAGNVSAPVNVSGTGQIKSGSLQVNGFRNLGNTSLDGTLSVGGNITSGGQSVITSLSAGSGISISGSGNSRTVTNTSGSIGSGTTNYISKWTGTGSTLGNSTIYDNGTNIGIGTATPAINLAIGDTDTGFKWISDGNFAAYSNNIDRMRINSNGSIEMGTRGLVDATGGDGYARVTISNPSPYGATDKYFDFYLKGGDNGGQFLVKNDGKVGIYPQGYNNLGATQKARAFDSALNIQSSFLIQPYGGSIITCNASRKGTLHNYNDTLYYCATISGSYKNVIVADWNTREY